MACRKRGGAEIGRGKYGCVHSPPLACKPGTEETLISPSKKQPVSKITTKGDALTEIAVSLYLKTIPNGSDYFVLTESACAPEPMQVQKEESLKDCSILKESSYKDLTLLIMPYSGLTLESNKRSFIQNYMAFGQHLLEAATLLLTKKLVHFDLHKNNILLSDKPKLIDFGYAWSPDHVNYKIVGSLLRIFNPLLSQESPDDSYVNAITEYKTESDSEVIIDYILKEKRVIRNIQSTLGVPLETLQEQLSNFVAKSQAIQNKDIVNYFKLYWPKFDAWAIGAVLTDILTEALFDPMFIDKVYTSNKTKLISILRGLTHMDPIYRLDAAEALKMWNPSSPVLKNPDVLKWLSSAS
jgi:serine/threonine protein kinase